MANFINLTGNSGSNNNSARRPGKRPRVIVNSSNSNSSVKSAVAAEVARLARRRGITRAQAAAELLERGNATSTARLRELHRLAAMQAPHPSRAAAAVFDSENLVRELAKHLHGRGLAKFSTLTKMTRRVAHDLKPLPPCTFDDTVTRLRTGLNTRRNPAVRPFRRLKFDTVPAGKYIAKIPAQDLERFPTREALLKALADLGTASLARLRRLPLYFAFIENMRRAVNGMELCEGESDVVQSLTRFVEETTRNHLGSPWSPHYYHNSAIPWLSQEGELEAIIASARYLSRNALFVVCYLLGALRRR